MGLFDQLAFSISVTGPICLILVMGVILKKTAIINDSFIESASNLVFKVTLPTMLFLSLVEADHDFATSASLVGFSVGSNLLFFAFCTALIGVILKGNQDNGVIVQGAFRANTGIIALAYVANMYGNEGLATAAIYVAATTLLYNVLAVISLTPKGTQAGNSAVKAIIKSITSNPLIISIMAGLVYSFIGLPVPKIASDAGHYFASMTLPLALLCTGGSLDLKSLKHETLPTWIATFLKLVIAPIVSCLLAYALGFSGEALGIIFFMTASPTAAASYVMARSMGGNSTLAANIIALTTILSVITTTLGLVILSSLNLLY
ncbi:transporter [Vibrio sp. UCD-FRSSP16_10]|uniref:AEC family transporter n=1 Tax=unclassified Vibrio TaxID=2614977 RepID=UPI000800B585|nr:MULTISPECIES: AEC family transporter [unclassified Vibrio]OBT13411.1 transporter [Vibrio sp. UCD-FRSSP16_10]OBT17921.1 transporter [Vibrio sp. UCD-FRSSP16_30]